MNGHNSLPDVIYVDSGGCACPQQEVVLDELQSEEGESAQPAVRRRRWRLPLLLFIATCLSTTYAGSWGYGLAGGLIYGVAVMTILACHEAGHFIQTRRYGVPASLPFFLPLPLPPIGTLGAVIGMDPRIANRRALFDIGITGPLAGLVPTMICCVVGLQLSRVAPKVPGPMEFGEPLLLQVLGWLTFGPIPESWTIIIHPIGMAGWVGLLITALNLMPIGQLDGGHILYGLLQRRANVVSTLVLASAFAAVMAYEIRGWGLMLCLLILMGPKHPPTADDSIPLGPVRVVLGWLTLAFVPIGFTPFPILSM